MGSGDHEFGPGIGQAEAGAGFELDLGIHELQCLIVLVQSQELRDLEAVHLVGLDIGSRVEAGAEVEVGIVTEAEDGMEVGIEVVALETGIGGTMVV